MMDDITLLPRRERREIEKRLAERQRMMESAEVRIEAGQTWLGLDGAWTRIVPMTSDGVSLADGRVILNPPRWLLIAASPWALYN